MVVQHNLRAMNSNRMLGLTASVQSKSTEKLSSGYKINRAADDAAGLSISEKMRKQIRGLSQASLNAADGISAVQTAEGALNEVQDMLQRMNELAVKASNGTMSTDDRSYIQDEIDQLITEIDRVSETTKFNETYLLKGDATVAEEDKKINFQYKDAAVISQDLYYLDGNEVKTLKAGTLKDAVDSTKTYYKDSDGSTAGVTIATSESSTYIESATVNTAVGTFYTKDGDKYVAVEKGDVVDTANVSKYYIATNATGAPVESNMAQVTASTQLNVATEYLAKGNSAMYDSATGATLEKGFSIGANSADISKYYKEKTNAILGADTVDYKTLTKNDRVQFIDKDGNEIAANGLYRYLDEDGKINSDELYVKTGEGILARREATQSDVDAMVNTEDKYDVGALSLKLHVGADATGNNQITLDIEAMSAKALGINAVKVDGGDDSNALDAIETIKEALNKVSDQRSALGAVQNRLEHTIANLDNVVENTTAAESQIRDTDMATEMVKYSNNNILAQAGQAMLAQANQANQGVLSILG